jgi:hypothetical protein
LLVQQLAGNDTPSSNIRCPRTCVHGLVSGFHRHLLIAPTKRHGNRRVRANVKANCFRFRRCSILAPFTCIPCTLSFIVSKLRFLCLRDALNYFKRESSWLTTHIHGRLLPDLFSPSVKLSDLEFFYNLTSHLILCESSNH